MPRTQTKNKQGAKTNKNVSSSMAGTKGGATGTSVTSGSMRAQGSSYNPQASNGEDSWESQFGTLQNQWSNHQQTSQMQITNLQGEVRELKAQLRTLQKQFQQYAAVGTQAHQKYAKLNENWMK